MVAFLSGLSDFITNKPEQFSIMADTIGRNVAPNNAFAGIGTAMGKSSLANKALQEDKAERIAWKKIIADIISGKEPMTAVGEDGVSALNVKPGKLRPDGTIAPNELTMSLTQPVEGASVPATTPPKSMNIGDLINSPF